MQDQTDFNKDEFLSRTQHDLDKIEVFMEHIQDELYDMMWLLADDLYISDSHGGMKRCDGISVEMVRNTNIMLKFLGHNLEKIASLRE